MIVGEFDEPCPPSEAIKYATNMTASMANYITLADQGHGIFSYYSGDDYMAILNAELNSTAPDSM